MNDANQRHLLSAAGPGHQPLYAALATMLALATLAAGCATTTAGVATETGRALCDVFRPIPWSARDTDETIGAVKAHNAKWEAMCGIKGVNLGGQ